MNSLEILRDELTQGHDTMEQAVADLSVAQLYYRRPGSTIRSIACVWAHTVMAEDLWMNEKLCGRGSLF